MTSQEIDDVRAHTITRGRVDHVPVVVCADRHRKAPAGNEQFYSNHFDDLRSAALVSMRRSREIGLQHHLVKPIDLNKLDSPIQ